MSAIQSGRLVVLAPLLLLSTGAAFAGSCIGGQDCPKLTGSPVSSGYWAWPRKKLTANSEIAAACRAPAFVASDGSPLDLIELPGYLRKIGGVRRNAEFNGIICRSLLAERKSALPEDRLKGATV